MLGTHSLGVFAATVLVVNATPGVDMIFTLANTLRHGVAGGIAAALGVAAGCVVHTLLAAFGLAALLAASSAGVRARQVGRRGLPACGSRSACCAAAWPRTSRADVAAREPGDESGRRPRSIERAGRSFARDC